MRKIASILLILIFFSHCSVSRKRKGDSEVVNISAVEGNIFQKVINQNLTRRNFFIEKAEFKIKSGAGEKTGIGTIKFVLPDKYLISLKSKAGIEVARIFLTEDSVMINDRLNKKLYYGSASDLKAKYGLTTAIIPVIFGDCINDKMLDDSKLQCKDDILSLDAVIKNIQIRYIIDCKYGKCIMTSPASAQHSSGIKLEYSDFFRSEGINIPGMISISESMNNTIIEIKIQRIIIPYEGSIEFIPGRQYEKIHLL